MYDFYFTTIFHTTFSIIDDGHENKIKFIKYKGKDW